MLSIELVGRLRNYVGETGLSVGEKLPPEHVLTEHFQVSRSVLREAVSALRAEGVLVSRRGSGVFVTEPGTTRNFVIRAAKLEALSAAVSVLELRACVEIEAAGLAALRRNREQLENIAVSIERMRERGGRDPSNVGADHAFHHAVARASGNEYFVDFLSYLGELLIPRQNVGVAADVEGGLDFYLDMLAREHREIFDAIRGRDAFAAREAMRRHLANALERYRQRALEAERNQADKR